VDTSLKITENIVLKGAGEGKTVIINGIAGGANRPGLIDIELDRDLPFRLTGFTFRRGSASTDKVSNGEIRISGISHSFRVDHCTFDKLHGLNINIEGFLWGVIDHCQFRTDQDPPIHIGHRNWNGEDWGHGSWADDPHWGSEKFVFIEDNLFEVDGEAAIDSYEGARLVVRYNKLFNTKLVFHGTEGQGRGAKQVEEYNNTYVFDHNASAGQIRSGCIVTHDTPGRMLPRATFSTSTDIITTFRNGGW
jgi:hypothetical protein